MTEATGVGAVTDAVRQAYIDYMSETLLCGMLAQQGAKSQAPRARRAKLSAARP